MVYINVSPIGGEMCNSYIFNSEISTSSYLKHASNNIFKEYPDIFVVKCKTMYSDQAYQSFVTIADRIDVNTIGEYTLNGPDISSCQSAISNIERLCGDRCLILNLCDSYYHQQFFLQYNSSLKLNPIDFPILSFTLDERLIDDIGAKYFEGHYAMGYYFNSMKTSYSEEIHSVLDRVYMIPNTVVTSDMALCYSQIYLLKNVLDVIYDIDFTKLKGYIYILCYLLCYYL